MKRKLCFILLLSLGLMFMSNISITKTVKAKRENIDEFLIGSWVSYYNTAIKSYEEQTIDMAESGINWILWPHRGINLSETPSAPSEEEWNEINRIFAENNMYYLMHGSSSIEDTVNFTKTLSNCNGYYVVDEPPASKFISAADEYMQYYELDQDRMPFVNMYPNYAGTANLGGTYEDYIRNWVRAVGSDTLEYLYFDHYPFTATETVRASYFSDIETIRKVAYENGRMKTGGFTQMGWWNGMREPNVDEARWSTNSLIAYGMKSISHFNWVAPKHIPPSQGGEGMMDFVLTYNGEKTQRYEPMQKLNWQIRQLGDLLMSIDCVGAYHTGIVPQGASSLPKSFVIKPDNSSDQLIISLFTTKDDSKKYISVFNKSTSENINTKLNIDPTSGIDGITYIKPDSFDILPDHKADLPAPSTEQVNINDNSFELSLIPGEIRFFRLEGDVNISEPISTPIASLKSGIHVGEQTVEITTPDLNAEIYYTLDGSYPTVYSKKYTSPIIIGKTGEIGRFQLRFVAIRGEEISPLCEYDYFITDDTRNVAYNKPVTIENGYQPFNCTYAPINTLNDGVNDPWKAVSTNTGHYGWAVIDFEQEYLINKVYLSTWGNWAFRNVIVQLSTTADFSSNVYTVYNNDFTNKMGQGAGVNESYVESGNYAGHTWEFEPFRARYIRCYNENAQNNQKLSIWTELMAFTAYEGGNNLLDSAYTWQMTGGGVWTINNNAVTQSDAFDANKWDRSYTLTTNKYKNFMLEGTFQILDYDLSQNGYVGFGIYKPTISSTQGTGNMGLYIGVEPKGRTFVYKGHGAGEVGPRNMEAIGFSFTDPFKLRIISIDDAISIYVAGRQVYYHKDEQFDLEAGYISIQSGPFKMKVKDVSITDMADFNLNYVQHIVSEVEELDDIAVDKLTYARDIIKELPVKIKMIDSSGKEHEVDVEWTVKNYDRTKTGWNLFEGALSGFPSNIKNLDNVKANLRVFVKADLDKKDFHVLIEKAESLNQQYFESESWAFFALKLQAAQELDQNPFAVQNDIGVVHFQLFDAIKALVSTVDKSSLQSVIDIAKEVKGEEYTTESFDLFSKALESAESIANDNIATPSEVQNAIIRLNNAYNNLKPINEVVTDKMVLGQKIENAKAYEKNKLSSEKLAEFESAILTAELIYNNDNSTQATIDLAVEMLEGFMQSDNGNTKGCSAQTAKGGYFAILLLLGAGYFISKMKIQNQKINDLR